MNDLDNLKKRSYKNPVHEKGQNTNCDNQQANDTTPENNENPNNELEEKSNNVPSVQTENKPSPDTTNQNEEAPSTQLPDIGGYISAARNALNSVDDIIMKGYLERLNQMEVVSNDETNTKDDVIIFKVNLMAYEKDEYATDKFVSAFSAMTYTANSIFLIVDGFEDHTDFYIGIKNNSNYTTSSVADTLESSLKGQFPGIKLENLSFTENGKQVPEHQSLLENMAKAISISSSIGVPALKGKSSYTNNNYPKGSLLHQKRIY